MTLAPRGLDWWGVEQSPNEGGSYRRGEAYRARVFAAWNPAGAPLGATLRKGVVLCPR